MARPVGSPRGLLPRFRPGATAALPAAGAAAGGACCVCCRAQGMAAGAPGSTAGSPCREASCRIIAAQPACRPPASCTPQVGRGTQRSAGLQDMAHVQKYARQHPEQGLLSSRRHQLRMLACTRREVSPVSSFAGACWSAPPSQASLPRMGPPSRPVPQLLQGPGPASWSRGPAVG